MKNFIRFILILVAIPLVVTFIAYQTYKPEDYCKTAEFAKKRYIKYSTELGMTYYQYESLDVYEQLSLIKKNTDYAAIKASYNLKNEAEIKCIKYINMSKLERFELDVYSGKYFK